MYRIASFLIPLALSGCCIVALPGPTSRPTPRSAPDSCKSNLDCKAANSYCLRGQARCICNTGYFRSPVGSGYKCLLRSPAPFPITPSIAPGSCKSNLDCKAPNSNCLKGQARCICNHGYIRSPVGNGFKCLLRTPLPPASTNRPTILPRPPTRAPVTVAGPPPAPPAARCPTLSAQKQDELCRQLGFQSTPLCIGCNFLSLSSKSCATVRFAGVGPINSECIPSEIGLLKNLMQLSFLDPKGNLVGSIPTEIGRLTNLESLIFLSAVNLVGTIPTEIGRLTNLSALSLSFNKVVGSIPTEIGLLTRLTDLTISGPKLNGRNILSDVVGLMKLGYLELDYEPLEGSIPTGIGALKELTCLTLTSYNLVGSIPTQIGMLTALEFLNLNKNKLVGTIPTQVGMLTELDSLNLDNNQLLGTIPSQIGRLTLLEYLFCQNNQLTGTIPTQINALPLLAFSDLSGNKLVGT